MGDFPDGGWDLPTTTFEDAASTLLATLTSSAIYASETLFNPDEGDQWGNQGTGWSDEGSGMGAGWNSSIPHMGEDILPPADSGNYFLNTLIGVVIVVSASALNAFGLNITKMDHIRTQAQPRRERKKEYLRPLWLAGMGMYIASQLFGSTLALRWLRPDWVAPLGATSLIFNFLFASWLVGTPVTPTDIRGTAVIVLGVVLILIFSSINHGLEQSLSVDRLNGLWTRSSWLAHFVFLILFTSSTYFVSSLLARLLASRASYSPLASPTLPISRREAPSHPVVAFAKARWAQWKVVEDTALKHLETIFQRADDGRITWLQGIGWAVCGGSLAGACLVFTKAVVKLLGQQGHPFLNIASIFTVLLTIFTAVLQIVCLNRALVCIDTVIVVPLFYAGYTVFGFVNSLIFYDETGQYATWVLVAVFLSIGVLVAGVTILSLKSSAKSASDPYTVTTEAEGGMRMQPRQRMPSQTGGNANAADAEGDDSAKRPATQRAYSGTSNPPDYARGGADDRDQREREVMWEVGSVSSDEDEPADRKGGPDGDGARSTGTNTGDARVGLGIKGARGERRGLLYEDDEDEQGALEVTESDIERRTSRDLRVRNDGDSGGRGGRQGVADDEDEGFGEFESIERERSPR